MLFKLTDTQFSTLQTLFAEIGTSRTATYGDIYEQLAVWGQEHASIPGSGVEPGAIAWLLGAEAYSPEPSHLFT